MLEPGTARFERRERSGRWGMEVREGTEVMLGRLPSGVPARHQRGWVTFATHAQRTRLDGMTDLSALLSEAAKKSGLLWIDVPGDRSWPAWHVWLDGTAYVVSGPGEQPLPALPAEVTVTFRSKDTGGRLVTVPAHATVVTADDPRWEDVSTALKASRLNAPAGDTVARWASEAIVYALAPHGEALDGPGSYSQESQAAQPAKTPATTLTWRPWHVKGRPKWRAGTRR